MGLSQPLDAKLPELNFLNCLESLLLFHMIYILLFPEVFLWPSKCELLWYRIAQAGIRNRLDPRDFRILTDDMVREGLRNIVLPRYLQPRI